VPVRVGDYRPRRSVVHLLTSPLAAGGLDGPSLMATGALAHLSIDHRGTSAKAAIPLVATWAGRHTSATCRPRICHGA
jgi:hypothetical protein